MLSEKDAVFPQIPQSTLIIVDNSYNNVTNTFTFIVQNTQDTLIYAQLYARFDSLKCGFLGDYHSSVNSFEIGQNRNIALTILAIGY